MQEVKRPKKPLIYFYAAMILAIFVFNCLVVPYLAGKAIEDVDYGNKAVFRGILSVFGLGWYSAVIV